MNQLLLQQKPTPQIYSEAKNHITSISKASTIQPSANAQTVNQSYKSHITETNRKKRRHDTTNDRSFDSDSDSDSVKHSLEIDDRNFIDQAIPYEFELLKLLTN